MLRSTLLNATPIRWIGSPRLRYRLVVFVDQELAALKTMH